MIDKRKLKGKIVERGMNIDTLSKELEMNKSTLYRRIKGEGKGISVDEVKKIGKILELSQQDINEIFFA